MYMKKLHKAGVTQGKLAEGCTLSASPSSPVEVSEGENLHPSRRPASGADRYRL